MSCLHAPQSLRDYRRFRRALGARPKALVGSTALSWFVVSCLPKVLGTRPKALVSADQESLVVVHCALFHMRLNDAGQSVLHFRQDLLSLYFQDLYFSGQLLSSILCLLTLVVFESLLYRQSCQYFWRSRPSLD